MSVTCIYCNGVGIGKHMDTPSRVEEEADGPKAEACEYCLGTGAMYPEIWFAKHPDANGWRTNQGN